MREDTPSSRAGEEQQRQQQQPEEEHHGELGDFHDELSHNVVHDHDHDHDENSRLLGPDNVIDPEEDGVLEVPIPEIKRNDSQTPISWADLPRKKQLTIITLARLSEPLVQTSLQSYLFYQLRWFDPSLPASTISGQAGVLHASFMAAQFVTAMIWGRLADSRRVGRKTVLIIGLAGTSLSCLGFGFSTTFWQALVFRTLGGATNGNIGVMRTM